MLYLSDQGESLGEYNLFHSMLGVLQVNTGEYDPALDLFAACRPGPASVSR